MTAPTHAELIYALREINRLHPLGDSIYSVRDSARESGDGYEGDSWEHPDVLAYAAAVEVVENALADSEG